MDNINLDLINYIIDGKKIKNKKPNIIETIPKILNIGYYYILFNVFAIIFLINSMFDRKSSYIDIIRYFNLFF